MEYTETYASLIDAVEELEPASRECFIRTYWHAHGYASGRLYDGTRPQYLTDAAEIFAASWALRDTEKDSLALHQAWADFWVVFRVDPLLCEPTSGT